MNPHDETASPSPTDVMLDIAGAHSCGEHCQRPMCVLRRELAEAKEETSRIYENSLQAHSRNDELVAEHIDLRATIERLKKERDEALSIVTKHCPSMDRFVNLVPTVQFLIERWKASVKGWTLAEQDAKSERDSLRQKLADAVRERDEARAAITELEHGDRGNYQFYDEAMKVLESARDTAIAQVATLTAEVAALKKEVQFIDESEQAEQDRLRGQCDMNNDEFTRIIAILSRFDDIHSKEVVGICERAKEVNQRTVPMIQELDAKNRSLEQLASELESLQKTEAYLRSSLAAERAKVEQLQADMERYRGWEIWRDGLWSIAHPESGPSAEWVAESNELQDLRADNARLRNTMIALQHLAEREAEPQNGGSVSVTSILGLLNQALSSPPSVPVVSTAEIVRVLEEARSAMADTHDLINTHYIGNQWDDEARDKRSRALSSLRNLLATLKGGEGK